MEKNKKYLIIKEVNESRFGYFLLLLLILTLLVQPVAVYGESAEMIESEEEVATIDDQIFEQSRALRPTYSTTLVAGDISGSITVTGSHIISDSRTPGILQSSAEQQLGSGYFDNVVWVANPSKTTFTLAKGSYSKDRTSATFSKLNETGNKWEQDRKVYNGFSISGRTVSIDYSQMTQVIKEYGAGVYRLNVTVTNLKGTQASFAIVINPESITPKIMFEKNGTSGTSIDHRTDPEAIKISSTHLMLNEPKNLKHQWVLKNTASGGETWTGENQEELTAHFNQLLKGKYEITLNVSAESQYGYTLKNTIAYSFTLTKDQVDYTQFIGLDLTLKNGFLRKETHYNPTDFLFGYHLVEDPLTPTIVSAVGSIQLIHQETGTNTVLYEGGLDEGSQEMALPKDLVSGSYEIRYAIEATDSSNNVLKKSQSASFISIPIEPSLKCDKVINPCSIEVYPIFTDSDKSDYELTILCGENVIEKLNGCSLDVRNLANLTAIEKTCYSLSFIEKLGVHPETLESVYTEVLFHEFDEKKPCPTIEIDQPINPLSIKLNHDLDLESLSEEMSYRWEILSEDEKNVVQQGSGDEILEEVLTALAPGKYKAKVYEEYLPYLTYENGSGFAITDFEVREMKVTLVNVPNVDFGEQTLTYLDNRFKLASENGLDGDLIVEDQSKGAIQWTLSVQQIDGFVHETTLNKGQTYIELNGKSLNNPVMIYESAEGQDSELNLTEELRNRSDSSDKLTGLIFPYSALDFEESGAYTAVLQWNLSQVPSSKIGGL